MKKFYIALLFCLTTLFCFSQNSRINDYNSIGWYAYTGTFKLDKKWSIHTEFQLRRDKLISDPQQNLYRGGLNFIVNPKLILRAGYALAETFNYGDYPINNFGKQFTEHRTYQMATLPDKIGIADINHRFMLEQRWVGRYSNASLDKEDEYVFTNRIRYMYRLQIPLKGKIMTDNTPYAAVYDEILVGFGKNVNENVFDQNRFGLLLGYRFSPKVRVEGGYLSQIVQLGREVGGRNVFQHNNGFILSTNFNF